MNREKKSQLKPSKEDVEKPHAHCYVEGRVTPGHTAPVVDLHLEFAQTSLNEKLSRMVAQAELMHPDNETKDEAKD